MPTSPENVQADLASACNHSHKDGLSVKMNPRCTEMHDEMRYLVRSSDVLHKPAFRDTPPEACCMEKAKNICHTVNAIRMNQIES